LTTNMLKYINVRIKAVSHQMSQNNKMKIKLKEMY
jgi:hypothetical protein